MKLKYWTLAIITALCVISMMAGNALSVPQDDKTRQRQRQNTSSKSKDSDDDKKKGNNNNNSNVKSQPTLEEDDEIPDSLLNTRWPIQRTTPISEEDLSQGSADLQRPENLKMDVVYNDTIDRYIFGNKIGGVYVSAPIMMDYNEYSKWSEKQSMWKFFQSKNEEAVKTHGKEKFDFTDMHFDLGPAEKIFGPGGVRIKTQGTAELKFGATFKQDHYHGLRRENQSQCEWACRRQGEYEPELQHGCHFLLRRSEHETQI